MTPAHAGQAITAAIICYGIFQIAVGVIRIVRTALFRRKLDADLKRCAENWSEGYKVWKERQAA